MLSQILGAASTVQYDTATLPAQQLGVDAPLEPVTKQQQRQSRLDGGDSKGDSIPFTCFGRLFYIFDGETFRNTFFSAVLRSGNPSG